MAAEVPVKVKPVDLTVRKYLERARSATPIYEERIKNPRRDPIRAAISMRASLEQKMARKETWDKWEARLSMWDQASWIDVTLKKGVQRYAQGVEIGADRYRMFYEQFSKHLEEGLRRILAMPKDTLDDSIRRAAEMIRWNAKFKFIKR